MLQMRLLVGLLPRGRTLSIATRSGLPTSAFMRAAFLNPIASPRLAKAFALYLERNGVKAESALCPAAKNKEDAQRGREDLIRGRKVVPVPFLD